VKKGKKKKTWDGMTGRTINPNDPPRVDEVIYKEGMDIGSPEITPNEVSDDQREYEDLLENFFTEENDEKGK